MTKLLIPSGIPTGRKTCNECAFHGNEGPDVVCRRFPPQVTVLLVPAPAPRTGMAPMPFATFPPVTPEHICGEFRATGAPA